MNDATTPRKPSFVWVLAGALVVAALVGVLAFGVLGRREPTRGSGPGGAFQVGDRVPALSLTTPDGRSASLASYSGKVVLVDFWATWCGPCHLQAQVLAPLYAEYQRKNVEFVAVSLGEDQDTVRTFLAGNPARYPVLLDPADAISSQYGIDALPTVMVLDREGKVTFINTGLTDPDALRQALAQAGAA